MPSLCVCPIDKINVIRSGVGWTWWQRPRGIFGDTHTKFRRKGDFQNEDLRWDGKNGRYPSSFIFSFYRLKIFMKKSNKDVRTKDILKNRIQRIMQ